jgi:hypothetical protein
MMNIAFKEDEFLLQEMQDAWNQMPDAFYKTHFELSAETRFDALSWRKFLTHPAVVDWLNQEMSIVRQAKLRNLLKDLSSDTKSTGLPQLINALASQEDKVTKNTEGPVFVYMLTPLNDQEEHAPNVQHADHNALEDILAD